MENGAITGPHGEVFTVSHLEHLRTLSSANRAAELELKDLREENERLKRHIEWQKAKLAQPVKLRKYAGPIVVDLFRNKQAAKK